ncbi:MAG: protein kinase domain-containing protein [Terrimicrobiaceae bacterium]
MSGPLRFRHFEVVTRPDGSPWILGTGKTGLTYKAYDTNLYCHVALKVIAPGLLHDPAVRARFLHVARAAAGLRHPTIAGVTFLAEDEAQIFYAMELVEGVTVEQHIQEKGPLESRRALEVTREIARALGAFHREHRVHRDIKPSSIMLCREEEGGVAAKLIDLGLAKSSGVSGATMAGRPYFVSPEQIRGGEPDIRSDIYSLGVTLLTMLTGRAAFSDSSPELPPELTALLEKMLAEDPAERFQAPAELRAAIEEYLESLDQRYSPSASRPSASAAANASLTLLDIMRKRRALPLPEALAVLERVAVILDSSPAPPPPLTLERIRLTSAGLADRPLDSCQDLQVGIISGSGLSPGSTHATILPGAQAADSKSQAIAHLALELLGGAKTPGRWTPLPALSRAGNANLQYAANIAQAYPTAAAVVAALQPGAKTAAPKPARPTSPSTPRPERPASPRRQTNRRRTSPAVFWLLGASIILLTLLGGVLLWFSFRVGSTAESPITSEPLTAENPTPAPAAVPPDPADPYLKLAEESKLRDDDRGALENYSLALSASPGKKGPREQMEMIASRLRSNANLLTTERFRSLRPALEKAASQGVVSAQMVLGEKLFKTDPHASLKWFAAAAAQGQTEAMTKAGLMMANGLGNQAPDFSAAVAWFQQGSAAGDTDAMTSLADCLLYGKGIAKNEVQALELLRTAAAFHHENAMNILGDLLKKGIPGVLEPDPKEAVRLFAEAAKMGFLDAQANLGVMYVNGLGGVKTDRPKAFALWKEGAELGNAMSMYFYAMALEGGLVTPPDPAGAKKWYVESARRGNPAANAWCRARGISFSPP